MAEHISKDIVAAAANCLNKKELQQLWGFAYSYLSIYPINAEASYQNSAKKGSLEPKAVTHNTFDQIWSQCFGKRVRSGVEDSPQRIVCATHPPAPSGVSKQILSGNKT